MDNICQRVLQYNVHAERPGSLRYAKVKRACVRDGRSVGPETVGEELTFAAHTGGQPDHDHPEEPGAQRREGGAGSALRAVGRTVRGGDPHEEAGAV